MSRAKKAKSAALLATLVLPLASACGIQPTGITVLGQAPGVVGVAAQQNPVRGAGGQFPVFFYLNDRLTAAYRSVKGEPTEQDVLDALLSGPTKVEAAKGFVSVLPPRLTAGIQADGLRYAYSLNLPLNPHAKAQFVCTMQYYDQTLSVGIQVDGSSMTWLACGDTTGQYIPMPATGVQSALSEPAVGQ